MQDSQVSRRVCVCVLALFVVVASSLAGASVAAREPGAPVVCAHISCSAGLALDSRGNLYTADSQSGHVFCVPPASSPILLAKVPGTPVVLTVDRLRTVFVGTADGAVYLVELDGTVREACRISAQPVGLVVDRDGGLLIATDDGAIVKVSRASFHEPR